MTIPKAPVFKFLLAWSAAGFAVTALVHVLSLINLRLVAPFGSVYVIALAVTFFLLILPMSYVVETDPMIREFRSQSWIAHMFSRAYYKAITKLMEEFTPTWAKIVAGGLWFYYIAQFVLLYLGNPSGTITFSANVLPLFSSGFGFACWGNLWFWHTQVVRLEKPTPQITL